MATRGGYADITDWLDECTYDVYPHLRHVRDAATRIEPEVNIQMWTQADPLHPEFWFMIALPNCTITADEPAGQLTVDFAATDTEIAHTNTYAPVNVNRCVDDIEAAHLT